MTLRMTAEQAQRHLERVRQVPVTQSPQEAPAEAPASVSFFVPSEPQGKKSPVAVSIGGAARVLKAAKTRAYEKMVALVAHEAMAGRTPIDAPVSLHMQVLMGVPLSWSKKKQERAFQGLLMPTRKPDLSNCIKACEDGMTGIVWRDDALVVDLWVSKRYGVRPGVRVNVSVADRPVEIRWPEAA
jgi:Holliday junction resolvase RusA-like endonuclease